MTVHDILRGSPGALRWPTQFSHAGLRRALDLLSDGLAAARPDLDVVKIGDALAPRHLLDAVAEGARAGAHWPSPKFAVEPPATVSAD